MISNEYVLRIHVEQDAGQSMVDSLLDHYKPLLVRIEQIPTTVNGYLTEFVGISQNQTESVGIILEGPSNVL